MVLVYCQVASRLCNDSVQVYYVDESSKPTIDPTKFDRLIVISVDNLLDRAGRSRARDLSSHVSAE